MCMAGQSQQDHDSLLPPAIIKDSLGLSVQRFVNSVIPPNKYESLPINADLLSRMRCLDV